MRTRSENKLPNARENASDQVAIGSSFESDWLRKWREFSGPITYWVKQEQSNPTIPSTTDNCSKVTMRKIYRENGPKHTSFLILKKKRIVALKKERIEIVLFLSVLRGVRSLHES